MRLDRDKTALSALHGGIKAREKYWQCNTSPGFFVVLIIRRNYERKNTAWILLVVSGLMEIVWAYTMKLSHGFTVLWPSVITIAILIISFFLLAKAVNTLGIGLSYAVFTGIGVVGTTFISIFVLKEGASLLKMLSLGVLIIGILGLKLCDKEGEAK